MFDKYLFITSQYKEWLSLTESESDPVLLLVNENECEI